MVTNDCFGLNWLSLLITEPIKASFQYDELYRYACVKHGHN